MHYELRMEFLMGKYVRQRNTPISFRLSPFILSFLAWKLIEVIPDILGVLPLANEGLLTIGVDMIDEPSVTHFRSDLANRQQFGCAVCITETETLERT